MAVGELYPLKDSVLLDLGAMRYFFNDLRRFVTL